MRYADLKIVEMAAIKSSSKGSIPDYLDTINAKLDSDDEKDRTFYMGKSKDPDRIFVADKQDPIDDIDDIIKGKGTNHLGKEVDSIVAGNIYKSADITGGVTLNMGDAAEAILGSAITAKFENGGGSIGENQLIKILKEAINKKTYKTKAKYKEGEEDSLTFNLELNAKSTSGIKRWLKEKDPMSGDAGSMEIAKKYKGGEKTGIKKVKELQTHVKNAVIYANKNERANTAVTKAAADPNANIVTVISDGGDATQQSITKVDLKIVYDGTSTTLLSLKAGNVRQFGQVSGAEFATITKFIDSMFDIRFDNELKEKYGFKDKESKSDTAYIEHNYGQPFKKLYEYTLNKLNQLIGNQDNERADYDFLSTLYKGINQHATLGEEGVTMVKLSPKAKTAYKELTFDNRLLEALKAYNFVVRPGSGRRAEGANHYIEVVGILKPEKAETQTALTPEDIQKLPAKDILVSLRSAVKAESMRNTIEMGDLLDDLADIEKMIAKNEKNPPEEKPEQPKQPAGTVTSKAGNQMKAGVDGKATVAPAEEPAPTG